MARPSLYPDPPIAGRVIRFGLEAPGGLRSGYWRLWRSGKADDVYLTARGAHRALKVSLHASGRWRWGWIADFEHEAVRRGFLQKGEDRAQQHWSRPASANGWVYATTVFFPGRDVTMRKDTVVDKPLTVNLIAPPADHVVAVHVWIVEAAATEMFPGWRKEHAVVAVMPLPSGAAVVVTAEQSVMTLDRIRDIDEAVLAAATTMPLPWEAIEASPAGRMRLTLHLKDEQTGAVRFVDLDAQARLAAVRRFRDVPAG